MKWIKRKIREIKRQYNIKRAPKNLDEAIIAVSKMKGIEKFKAMKESEICLLHHSTGQWIRNNWGLWSGSPLQRWFHQWGIYHADDMSGIILDSAHRSLHGKEIRLEEQVSYYRDYWKKQGVDMKKEWERNNK